jgi:transcription elongation factor Elf1
MTGAESGEDTNRDEMRKCAECGEEAKPITVESNPKRNVVRCPLCGAEDEVPKY